MWLAHLDEFRHILWEYSQRFNYDAKLAQEKLENFAEPEVETVPTYDLFVKWERRLRFYIAAGLGHNGVMNGRESDRRLKLEAEILFHLWAEGATPMYRLVKALPAPWPAARAAISSLTDKRYIYKLFEPPEDEVSSVYYLTADARGRLAKLFRGDPRYHLKQLWYTLKQEETKVRAPQLRLD